jgi:hypothetical protein
MIAFCDPWEGRDPPEMNLSRFGWAGSEYGALFLARIFLDFGCGDSILEAVLGNHLGGGELAPRSLELT